jgi:hypothetical protein
MNRKKDDRMSKNKGMEGESVSSLKMYIVSSKRKLKNEIAEDLTP